MNQYYQHKKSSGFTIVEVMVAMLLSMVALLGLAAAQIKSLQYATNSFNYTVALIQANNAVERTWVKLCDIQKVAAVYDNDFIDSLDPIAPYTISITPAANAGATFNANNNLNVTVSWSDERVDNALANQVQISAEFPNLCL